jgi:hypothetical protein
VAAVAEIAGDIAAVGGTASGLILVYVGALSKGFLFHPTRRRTVSASQRRRMWFAVVGLVLLLLSVTTALLGKHLVQPSVVIGALVLLLVGLFWLAATTVFTAWHIASTVRTRRWSAAGNNGAR